MLLLTKGIFLPKPEAFFKSLKEITTKIKENIPSSRTLRWKTVITSPSSFSPCQWRNVVLSTNLFSLFGCGFPSIFGHSNNSFSIRVMKPWHSGSQFENVSESQSLSRLFYVFAQINVAKWNCLHCCFSCCTCSSARSYI